MIAKEILAINDGSLLLPVMGGLLTTRDYRLSLTDSPEEALVLLNNQTYHLVVVKLDGEQSDRLPVMHMVKELRDNTKLIIIADKARPPVGIFEIEADDYILLPCRMLEIWRRLLHCLEPSYRQPETFRSNSLIHPANRRTLNNLSLLFLEMQDQATAIIDGLQFIKNKLNGRLAGEAEAVHQEAWERTQNVTGMTEDFFQMLLDIQSAKTPPGCIDLEKYTPPPKVCKSGTGLRPPSSCLD